MWGALVILVATVAGFAYAALMGVAIVFATPGNRHPSVGLRAIRVCLIAALFGGLIAIGVVASMILSVV